MRFILKLKHWQLLLMIMVTSSWPSRSHMKDFMHLIALLIFVTWIYAVGIYGQRKARQMNLPSSDSFFFKLNVCSVPVLSTVIFLLKPALEDGYTIEFKPLDILLIVLLLYLIFALLHIIFFASKTLAIIENKRKVTFKDCFWDFISFILFGAGVWVLQPKITRLLADNPYAS